VSEPKEVAQEIVEVATGVWRWQVWDDRIGAESHAHALASRDGTVLIDPLPLAPELLRRLEPIAAILLSAACHQRAAWRYRRSHGVAVYPPDATRPMEEEPDFRYGAGQELPGGIVAVHTPGPEPAHYAFWREASPAVVFSADLIMRKDDDAPEFVPPEYHDDPAATHDSLRRLLQLPFEVFCMAHGEPLKSDRRGALQELFQGS
jgi:glyoxylase-like metal-dependent hydrolase (beta-lactamase superfamily II)